MPAPTVDELLTPLTEDDLLETQLGVFSAAGFPVTSWASTSVPNRLARASSRTNAALATQIPAIVKGGYARDAGGAWLDSFLESNYQENRKLAIVTRRRLRLTDDGAGATPLTSGTVVTSSDEGLHYVLDEDGTVPASGFVDLIFRGEIAGADYNAATGGWSFVTSLPGIALSEPAPDFVQQGVDVESDDEYRQRGSVEKWPTLAFATNDDGFSKLAKEADPQVKRVLVRRHVPAPGQVTITVAGAAGAFPDDTVPDAVVAYVAPRAPNCVDVFAESSTDVTIALVGEVRVVAKELASAQSKAIAALATFSRLNPIGSRGGLPLERITALLLIGASDDPRNDVDLTAPVADTAIGTTETVVFDVTGLTWVAV